MVRFNEVNILNFTVITCTIYLAILPFGLPHIGFLIGLLVFFSHISSRKYTRTSLVLFLIIIYSFFLLAIGSDLKVTINNMSSMMMFPIIIEFFRKRSIDSLLDLSHSFIKTTIICFTIEALIRYPLSFLFPLDVGIYRFKFHSILFQDTNFLGLVLLIIIFYIRFLEIFFSVKSQRKYSIVAIILLFLSISRAAILAWIICEFLLYKTSSTNIFRKYFQRLLLLGIMGIIVGTTLFIILQEDTSFKSKLYILDLIENGFKDFKINIITGVGLGNAEAILGIFPHNSILLYFLETGIIGILFKAFYLLYIFLKTKWTGLIIFLPYFIATMSATGYATHYLYVTLALISLLYSKRRNNKINILTK